MFTGFGVSCKRSTVPIGTAVRICKCSNLKSESGVVSMIVGKFVGGLFDDVVANPEILDPDGVRP
jgi:UDP-glucose 6-dehydrogenase